MKTLVLLAFCFFQSNFCAAEIPSSRQPDSLLTALEKGNHDLKSKERILTRIAKYYSDSLQDRQTALLFFAKALNINKLTKDTEAKGDLLNSLGICYGIIGNNDSAIICFEKYGKICIKLNDSIGLYDAYQNMGLVYEFSGKYEKALEYYIKSSKVTDSQNDTIRKIVSYLSIGGIYRSMQKNDKAKGYFEKALELNNLKQDKMMFARIYNQIAMLHKSNGNLDSALYCYEKTLENSRQIEWKKGIATALSNIGNVYKEKEQYEEALKYHLESLNLEEELSHYYGIMISKLDLAELYNHLGNYEKTEMFANEVIDMATSANNLDVLSNIYLILHKTEKNKGDYKKAMDYFEKYSNFKDSLYDEETTARIAEIETKYQVEKRDNEIKFLNIQRQLDNEKIDKQDLFIKMLTIILLVVGIMSIILGILYFQKRKAWLNLVKINKEALENEDCPKLESEDFQKYKGSNLDEDKIHSLKNEILVLMEEEKFYLNKNFSIEEMARVLETNRQYVSQIINEKFGKNFNNFINEYRIKEARRLLANDTKNIYTIEGIAQEVGFNSRTSFISAFKKYTGVTPSFFKRNINSGI
ncbi:MAG: tetratricopeptide repeat protein [Bacteroidales bacterium]|nr:tetratricopeptide repeat protein [Bacteroidales bacterium]